MPTPPRTVTGTVLVGTLDEPALRRIATIIAAAVPNGSLATIPGAKHHLNLDRPEEFENAVRRFLLSKV